MITSAMVRPEASQHTGEWGNSGIPIGVLGIPLSCLVRRLFTPYSPPVRCNAD
jgi:hypothetical protein